MKLTVIVKQWSGQVTDRMEHTFAALRENELSRSFVLGFHQMLRENLPAILDRPVSFSLPLPVETGTMELVWSQLDPFSAMVTFFVSGKIAYTAAFLSGCAPDLDCLGVRFAQLALEDLCTKAGAEPKIALAEIKDRPVVVIVPWSTAVSLRDQRRISAWSITMGVAFFEKAIDFTQRINGFLETPKGEDWLRKFDEQFRAGCN